MQEDTYSLAAVMDNIQKLRNMECASNATRTKVNRWVESSVNTLDKLCTEINNSYAKPSLRKVAVQAIQDFNNQSAEVYYGKQYRSQILDVVVLAAPVIVQAVKSNEISEDEVIKMFEHLLTVTISRGWSISADTICTNLFSGRSIDAVHRTVSQNAYFELLRIAGKAKLNNLQYANGIDIFGYRPSGKTQSTYDQAVGAFLSTLCFNNPYAMAQNLKPTLYRTLYKCDPAFFAELIRNKSAMEIAELPAVSKGVIKQFKSANEELKLVTDAELQELDMVDFVHKIEGSGSAVEIDRAQRKARSKKSKSKA